MRQYGGESLNRLGLPHPSRDCPVAQENASCRVRMQSSVANVPAAKGIMIELLGHDEVIVDLPVTGGRGGGHNHPSHQLQPSSVGEVLRGVVPIACQQPKALQLSQRECNSLKEA